MPADVRRNKLYENLLSWIAEHTEDVVDYANALKNSGFKAEEIKDELVCNLDFTNDEADDVLREIGMIDLPNQMTINLDALDRALGSYKNAFDILSIPYTTFGALIKKCRIDG